MDLWLRSATRSANWVVAIVGIECLLLAGIIHAQGIFTHVGMDFLTTYTAADMLVHGERRHLYDTRTQWEYQRPIIYRYDVRWEDRVMHPYTTPPLLAVAGIPLLLLSPAGAALVWALLGLLAVLLALRLLATRLALDGRLLAMLVLGSFPLFYIVLLGQVDGFLFLAFALFIVELRAGHEGRAGLALSAWTIKPPLLPAALVFLLVTGRKRAFAATLASGLAQGAVSMLLVGRSGIAEYIRLSRRLALPAGDVVTNVGGMVNLRAMIVRALPVDSSSAQTTSIAIATALTLLAAAWLWRRAGSDADGAAGVALLALTTVLTCYHALYHSAILAVLAVALLAQRLLTLGDETRAARLVALSWVFFSFGPLLLFLVVPTSRLPAALSSAGILLAWGVAAYAIIQPAGQPGTADAPRPAGPRPAPARRAVID